MGGGVTDAGLVNLKGLTNLKDLVLIDTNITDAAVKDLLTAMEPVMIVFLGVVVGGVVISMYMPLFSLIGKLSGK